MLQNHDIVTFANDWSADPTSKHHIMKRLANRNRVLWVEAAGMRKPNLTKIGDIQRILAKLRSLSNPRQTITTGLRVYSPPTLPLPTSSIGMTVNRMLYRRYIGSELRRQGMATDPMLWVYGPHVASWIRDIPRRCLVYHCVDRWSAFKDYDADFMASSEAEICRAADLVIASAEDLAERCRQHSSNVHYIPHGVDHAHFSSALTPAPFPSDLASIPEPRIGFFGLIHEWVDIDLIGRLADRLPFSFVLVGKTNQDLAALKARNNVFHLGHKPYADLPAYCRGFAAAIVPFRMSELTYSVNPIKLREYAAAGLPIVSSDLPEVRRCSNIAVCATTDEEWCTALQEAVHRGANRSFRLAQSQQIRGDDWDFVCDRISSLISG